MYQEPMATKEMITTLLKKAEGEGLALIAMAKGFWGREGGSAP